jgi:FAD/FMN-containing dehydrogenase
MPTLLSWGRYPNTPQTATACHWPDDLGRGLEQQRHQGRTTLAYGAGLSYGDSGLAASDHVLHTVGLDRFVAADWTTGRVTAQAGVTFEQILAVAIPRGWYLPVSPGTKYVTLGGAIANDVHGKNHHRRGTLGRHVVRLGLRRSDRAPLVCSSTEEVALFQATIGGLGLTGLIEWAELQLTPIRSSRIRSVTQRFDTLDEFFALSATLDLQHEFCVSWVDCAASGNSLGRGVYMAGDFADDGPLEVAHPRRLTMPVTPPVSPVTQATVRAFNALYWRRAPRVPAIRTVSYEPFFYPLDSVLQWNRVYGPAGFQQYQCVIPEACARDGVSALLREIAASGLGSPLAVLKRCGDLASPGLLSFPMAGTTLALDFPHSDRLTHDLFPRLDAVVREAGGRLYPAKDAHMSARDFQATYPAWTTVEALRDPQLLSRFWQRVTR